jgi:hypothetical protein
MAGVFGHLNIAATERAFNATIGQRVIFDAATEYINRANAELAAALAIFVSRSTSDFKLRYKLPGGGYLQERGPDGRYGAVKAQGSWDVAFPLRDYGAMIAGNDVAMAYMTIGELDNHISTIVAQNVNTVRHQVLRRMFKNTTDTFVDDIHGSLTIQPLANGDSVTFPPVIGSASEATEDHYAESNYAESAISDTNDPYEVIVPELEEHFGTPTGGSNIVTFINDSARAETQALTDFFEVNDNYIRTGANTDVPINLPSVPGRIIGRHKAGTWISVWNFVPSNYALGVHLEADPPLIRRIDPADTGLGDGLQLVAEDMEFPFEESVWRHRFGIGCGNRLNGYVMEFGTGGTYTIPTAYQS